MARQIRMILMVVAGLMGAESCEASSLPFSGATLGGELGYGIGSVEHKQEDRPVGGPVVKISDSKLAPSGVVGNLAIGYNWRFAKCFVLGGDLYGGLSSLSVKHFMGGGNPDINTTVKMRNSLGLRLRPGVMISPTTLLHGTLGYAWSQWKITASADADNPSLLQAASLKKRVSGFSFGGGMITQVRPRLGIGLEFIHTVYKKFFLDQKPTPVALAGGANLNDVGRQTFKPSANTVALRVVYGF